MRFDGSEDRREEGALAIGTAVGTVLDDDLRPHAATDIRSFQPPAFSSPPLRRDVISTMPPSMRVRSPCSRLGADRTPSAPRENWYSAWQIASVICPDQLAGARGEGPSAVGTGGSVASPAHPG